MQASGRLPCFLLQTIAVLLIGQGAALSQPIYADDPAAAAVIDGWYATLQPALSPGDPIAAAQPPATDIVDLLAERMAAEAAAGIGPPTPGERGADAQPFALDGLECTFSEVRSATQPFRELLLAQIAEIDARRQVLYPDPPDAQTDGAADLIIDPYRFSRAPYSENDPYSLEEAAMLDRLAGGQYWTARWHQYHAFRHVTGLTNMSALPLQLESSDAGSRLGRDSDYGVKAIQAAFQNYLAMRASILEGAAVWLRTLRGLGCGGLADVVHFRIAVAMSFGPEADAIHARGRHYWGAFGFAAGFDLGYSPVPGFGFGYRTDPGSWYPPVVDAALDDPITVEAFLGPLPPAPAEEPVVPVDVGERAVAPGGATPPVVPVATPPNPGRPVDPDAAPPNWDAPVAANPRPVPGTPPATAPGTDSPTFVGATGVGTIFQPAIAGFWRFAGIEDSDVTLLRLDPEQSYFEGFVVVEGAVSGAWLEMRRDADTTGWRGQVHIALRDPDGACPRWVPGVFIVEPGATILNGAWAGPKVDPETCADTATPDGDAIRMERVVATTFQPIVPGKYIHLIGAPPVGPNPAQYSAGVEFACDRAGLPVDEVRVVADRGRVVELAACRYQFVVDAPGTYDIRVEFIDAGGDILHVDNLRAEIPAIPGLLQ